MHKIDDLIIWNKAIDVCLKVYELTSEFPIEEKFGLTSQLRRSAVSISSNIAEGAGRNSDGEFVNFLGIANGSSFELLTQLVLTYKLKIVEKEKVEPILNDLVEIQKMNYVLIKKLSKK